MAKTRKHRESGGLLCLASFDLEDSELIQVVIETPKSGRNKYAFDPDQNIFTLTKILPAGTIFPDDFGFVPSTTAEDGDPVDVLVLMDGTVFPGCLLRCRRIGIIEGEQGKRKETGRNDRIIALEQAKHTYELVKHAQDLGE